MDQSDFLPPNQVDSTSSRLLRQLGKNDPDAWRQFVRVYGPVVRYWIRQAGLNNADLADVFQNVFIAVSRNIVSFQRQSGQAKFRAWLKTVTHSKIQDHFRRLVKQPQACGGSTMVQRMNELPDDEESSSGSSEANRLEDGCDGSEDSYVAQRMLEMVRREFREKTWLAFYRTAVDGLTSQEVAAELGVEPAAVRKAKSRVLARLREVLGG